MQRMEYSGELERLRAVMAFARATGAPSGAVGWLLRMATEAEARRAGEAANVTLSALLPGLDFPRRITEGGDRGGGTSA